jgi:hypothetical protein
MLHFFRSEGWQVEALRSRWLEIVAKTPLLLRESGRCILVGDGVKQAKEGRRMPGVTKHHQESDNSAKGEFIHGHLFGGVGVLAGNSAKTYCILLSARLHDGVAALQKWLWGDEHNEESHVVKIIRDAAKAVSALGNSILLLDRLYLTKPMLMALAETPGLSVVTKAKSNATAYLPEGKYKGRGPKPKKGEAVKVSGYFSAAEFTAAEMNLYGKDKTVKYFCIDLKWGKGLYRLLRFVLTIYDDGVKSVLVSTDLSLTPEQIILLYCRRFKIECAFRELKQVVAGFSYHFWSKAMPWLRKFKDNETNRAELEAIDGENRRRLIRSAVKAIEGYVQVCIVALGMLQLVGLLFGNDINRAGGRFMRTVSSAVPSERTVADYMRKNIYMLFRFFPHLALTSIIRKRQPRCSDGTSASSA